MPYVIAVVVLIVGALAFFALRSPVEAPTTELVTAPATTTTPTAPAPGEAPEGFVEPTEPPPSTPDPTIDIDTATDDSLDPDPQQNIAISDVPPAADEQTFSAEASYFTPRRTEHDMLITLTLKDNVVASADIMYDGGAAVTPSHSAFDATYESEVIGKKLNEINLSRVGGASLTSAAFNEAIADIIAQTR